MGNNYKYYAVRQGWETGVYGTWDECRKNVQGYSDALYKGFDDLEAAERFVREGIINQTITINKENANLQELVRLAKGERTAKRYAQESGVSASNISRLLSGSIKTVSPTIAKKLTSDFAQPRNGVTYEDLMNALGYTPGVHTQEWEREFLERHREAGEAREEIEWKLSGIKDAGQSEKNIEQLYLEKNRFNGIAMGILYKGLSEKGFQFLPVIPGVNQEKKEFKCDMDVMLQNVPLTRWSFLFCNNYYKMNVDWLLQLTLSKLLFMEQVEERKVSIVTRDREVYERLIEICCEEGRVFYAGELSAILVEDVGMLVKEETYLLKHDEIYEEICL